MTKFVLATYAVLFSFAVTVPTAIPAQEPATGVDYRWSFYTGAGGTSNASIKTKDGSLFEVSCAALGNRKMGVFLKSPIARARNQDIQVVVDDDDFHFNLTNGTAEIGGRHGINQLGGLVDALRKTKATHFTVELPATGKSISFSTLGAAKNLKDILAGCLGAIQSNMSQSPSLGTTSRSALDGEATNPVYYISQYWRIYEDGIYDLNKKTYLFPVRAPAKNLNSLTAEYGLVLEKKITARAFGSNQTIGAIVTVRIAKTGHRLLSLDLRHDTLNDTTLPVAEGTITALSELIPDRSGTRVGMMFRDAPDFQTKRMCKSGEGMWSCHAAYSKRVTYNLPDRADTANTPLKVIPSERIVGITIWPY